MKEMELRQIIESEINKLGEFCGEQLEKDLPAHEIEKNIFKELLRLGFRLLHFVLTQKIGRLKSVDPEPFSGETVRKKGVETRKYLSLFGLMELSRPSFWSEARGKFHLADEVLKLPKGSFLSYNLQGLIGESSAENDFKESVRVLNKMLDLDLSGKLSERNAWRLGDRVDRFYELKNGLDENLAPSSAGVLSVEAGLNTEVGNGLGLLGVESNVLSLDAPSITEVPILTRRIESPFSLGLTLEGFEVPFMDLNIDNESIMSSNNLILEEAPNNVKLGWLDREDSMDEGEAIFVELSVDAAGVTMVDGERTDKPDNPKRRLGKGEKKGTKRMATASVVSTYTPKERDAQKVIDGLTGRTPTGTRTDDGNDDKKEPYHRDIHRRAFLGDQNKAIEYGLQLVKQRMGNPNSRFVVVVDGGPGLEEKVLEHVEKMGLKPQFDGILMDIIHVSEYIWDGATAIFGEKSKVKQSVVAGLLKDTLESEPDKVIEYFERTVEKTKLTDAKLNQVNKTLKYFINHEHKMDYKTFMEKGNPISSALVESTCKCLIRERMEQSGMRWSGIGAQHVMDLRAIKLNGHMDEFMEYVIEQDHCNVLKQAA